MTKTLVLVIAALVVLALAARPIAALVNSATPLVALVGVLLIVWQLVRYFTRL